jgi:hypothetical protein
MRNKRDVKSSHPWIESACFEDMDQSQVLRQVIDTIHEERKKRIQFGGKEVKVVFDIDSTIFDVKPRTLRILKEFALSEGKKISPRLAEWCLGLRSYQLSYTIQDTALANAFPKEDPQAEIFMRTLIPFWRRRFFSHAYVMMDHPSPGAVDYAQAVVDAGAEAVYLTGRDAPGMGRGTRSMLEHWGFPLGQAKGELIMKPYFGMDDAEFKDEALLNLRAHADVVALFDNEPANFHVFEKNFPEAFLIFMHSNCSRKEARGVKKVYRIEDFLRLF